MAIVTLFASAPLMVEAQRVNFTAGEAYVSGRLDAHPDWQVGSTANINATQERVEIDGFVRAVFSAGVPLSPGNDYTAEIDFTFLAGDQSALGSAPFRTVISAALFGENDPAGGSVKVSLNRVLDTYTISLTDSRQFRENFLQFNDRRPSASPAVNTSELGINRRVPDLQSDPLRLRITARRGPTENEWIFTGELFNRRNATDDLITSVSLAGVTFVTGSEVRGGFTSGQSDRNARFSNRFINSFEFRGEERLVPFVLPSRNAVLGSVDANGNGIADLSELLTPSVAQLPPAEDADGDGISNLDELRTGTDPFDSSAFFRSSNIARAALAPGNQVAFSFSSVPGIRYTIQHSSDLNTGSWTPLRDVDGAVGDDETTVMISMAGLDPDRSFFRAGVLGAIDSDSDGLEDNLELFLGFDPNNPSSVNSTSTGGDFAQFARLYTGSNRNGGILSGTEAGVPSPEQTSRFLAQATFGPTENLIDYVRSFGENAFEKWIDEQLSIPPTLMDAYRVLLSARVGGDTPSSGFSNPDVPHFANIFDDVDRRNADTVWMRQALFAPDKLRQRVAWALSQILVASTGQPRAGEGLMVYYDLLLEHALGNYEDLLYEVSVNPLMGNYLSSLGNRVVNPSIGRFPDENYAREIMQLFSIGLWELNLDGTRVLDSSGNPIATYTNDDIVQVARVFTGLEFSISGPFNRRFAAHPMRMNEGAHDVGAQVSVDVYGSGEKRFLQSFRYTPEPLPVFGGSGRSGLDDIRDTVSILFNHPNCAPFISKTLIQHLVTSNPPKGYIRRVARVFENDGTGTRGNLGAVVRAILLDRHARDLQVQFSEQPGRLKAPMLRFASLASAFDAGAESPSLHDLEGIQFFRHPNPAQNPFTCFQQFPFRHPSVFNFFQPGYSHPGEIRDQGLLSPEFQILNSVTAIAGPNMFYSYITNLFHNVTRLHTPPFEIEIDDYLADAQNNLGRLLDRLNLLLCHGRLSAGTREIILASLQRLAGGDARQKVEHSIYLILTSPDAAVLR